MKPATGARVRLAAALAAGALALAACSDDGAPVAPTVPDGGDAPTQMLSIEGAPRVSITFEGGVTEVRSGEPVTGPFRALVDDSLGRRVFPPAVTLNGAPLDVTTDPNGAPVWYSVALETALPQTRIEDTLRLAIEDGGPYTPPCALAVAPSRVILPADSTRIARDRSLELRWTGTIERLIVTITDGNGRRVRFQLTLENSSALAHVAVPARDLATLAPGPLQVATNILDTETRLLIDGRRIAVSFQSTQRRVWILEP